MQNKKINIRKIVYIICFMLLNLIEWIKGTQGGGVWMIAVNCTGLIMAVIVLSAWPVKELRSRISGIYTILCGAALVGVYLYWSTRTGYQIITAYLIAVVNVWLVGIMVIHLIRRGRAGDGLLLGRENRKLWIVWLLFSVLSVASVSDKVWPIWFFFMFGLFYLTDFEKHKETLADSMVTGTLLSFFLIQSFAYGFRPYDEVRYKGPFSNCNMTALYYLVIYCMVLIKIHFLALKHTKWWKQFPWFVAAGGLLAFQFLTLCRTAWMCSALLTGIYALWIMRKMWKEAWCRIAGKCALILLCAVVTFPVVFASARWLPTILHRPVWYEGEWSVNKVHSFDPADSDKYVSMDEFLHTAFDRFYQILDLVERNESLVLKADAEDSAARISVGQASAIQMSAARFGAALAASNPILEGNQDWTSAQIRSAIYKVYLENLNLTGHAASEGHYQITDNYHAWHAQNLWLQAAHDFGIPAGILLIVITVMLLGRLVSGYRKGKIDEKYGVIPLLMTVLFFSFGIMEIVWNPGQLVLFLFFFALHPDFYGGEGKKI